MAQPLSFHDAPFYPPLQARNREPDLVSRFQKLHPRWYERVETNRNTADIAGKTSFVAGLVTLSSYFFLGGTPRFVLTAVSALGGVTVISGIASAFFSGEVVGTIPLTASIRGGGRRRISSLIA